MAEKSDTPSKAQNGAEIVRTVTDVNDAVEGGLMTRQERVKLFAWEYSIQLGRRDSFGRNIPLHMLGLHPTWHLCWGPLGSTRRRSSSSPEASHSAGLVMISSKSVSRPRS